LKPLFTRAEEGEKMVSDGNSRLAQLALTHTSRYTTQEEYRG